MTSANTILYRIYDKNKKVVGNHSQNIMCKRCNDDLLKFLPAEDFIILPHGYDEEEEWEDKKINLKDWLRTNIAEITFIKFNEDGKVKITKKRGFGLVLKSLKGKWYPEYLVRLESGEEITISQTEIIPQNNVY